MMNKLEGTELIHWTDAGSVDTEPCIAMGDHTGWDAPIRCYYRTPEAWQKRLDEYRRIRGRDWPKDDTGCGRGWCKTLVNTKQD